VPTGSKAGRAPKDNSDGDNRTLWRSVISTQKRGPNSDARRSRDADGSKLVIPFPIDREGAVLADAPDTLAYIFNGRDCAAKGGLSRARERMVQSLGKPLALDKWLDIHNGKRRFGRKFQRLDGGQLN